MSDERLTAIEIGEASSVAVTRVQRFGGGRSIALTVAEIYPPITVRGVTIGGSEADETAEVHLDAEQIDRLIAALTAGRAWLGEDWRDRLLDDVLAGKESP